MNFYLIILLFFSLTFSSETIGLVMKQKGRVDYIPYDKSKKNRKLNVSESLFNQDLIKTGIEERVSLIPYIFVDPRFNKFVSDDLLDFIDDRKI